jgi:hypothetical protein
MRSGNLYQSRAGFETRPHFKPGIGLAAVFLPPIHLSPRRRPGSISPPHEPAARRLGREAAGNSEAAAKWVPAFAGMTADNFASPLRLPGGAA